MEEEEEEEDHDDHDRGGGGGGRSMAGNICRKLYSMMITLQRISWMPGC